MSFDYFVGGLRMESVAMRAMPALRSADEVFLSPVIIGELLAGFGGGRRRAAHRVGMWAARCSRMRYARFEARDILRPLHVGVSWVPVSAVEKHPERATEFLWR